MLQERTTEETVTSSTVPLSSENASEFLCRSRENTLKHLSQEMKLKLSLLELWPLVEEEVFFGLIVPGPNGTKQGRDTCSWRGVVPLIELVWVHQGEVLHQEQTMTCIRSLHKWKFKIKLNGEWIPLLALSKNCVTPKGDKPDQGFNPSITGVCAPILPMGRMIIMIKKKKKIESQYQKQASFPPSQLSLFSSTVLKALENDTAQGKTWETIEYQSIYIPWPFLPV